MNGQYLVNQGTALIEAKQKKPLTAREQKMVLTLVSMIQPKDEEFKEYEMSIAAFSDLLQVSSSSSYNEIKKNIHNLVSKTIEIPLETGRYLVTNWVSSVEYIEREGKIKVTFQPKLKPYLLQLQQYTSYKLTNILSLNSVYAIRLYELAKRWEWQQIKEIELDDLRSKIGAIGKSYKVYANLKGRINQAVKEINEKTDVELSYTEIKRSRTVEKLKFTVVAKNKAQPIMKEIIEVVDVEESTNQYDITENENIPVVIEPESFQEDITEDNLAREFQEMEEMRLRINERTKDYTFDSMLFFDIYNILRSIFKNRTEEEMLYLIDYINDPNNEIEKPIGFIKYQLKKIEEPIKNGLSVTFKDLRTPIKKKIDTVTRTTKVPEWFQDRKKKLAAGEPLAVEENSSDLDFEEERNKILAKLEN